MPNNRQPRSPSRHAESQSGRTTSREGFRARAASLRAWRRAFLGASTLQERLRLLVRFGLDDRDLVKSLRRSDVTERSVRRWRTEAAPVRPGDRWDAIDDVCAIIGYFLSDGTYDEQAILAWLRSRHEVLDHQRPLDAIGAGHFDDVQMAAEHDLGVTAGEEHELLPLPANADTARRDSKHAGDETWHAPAGTEVPSEPARST